MYSTYLLHTRVFDYGPSGIKVYFFFVRVCMISPPLVAVAENNNNIINKLLAIEDYDRTLKY